MMLFHHISNQFVLLLHSAIEKQNAMHYAVSREPQCNTAVVCLNKIGKIEVINQSILAICFEVSIEIILIVMKNMSFSIFQKAVL